MKELFKSIVCPVDLDELYAEALELSSRLAEQNNAKLYVLNVASELEPDHAWQAANRASLHRQVSAKLKGKVEHEFVTRIGDVVGEIFAAVKAFDADLIVIPTHGRHGLKKVMLGSVAERVVRDSPVPVLTLRAR